MSGKVADLDRARRERVAIEKNDGREWTPEDALRGLLEAIEALPEEEKPTKMIAVVRRDVEDPEPGFMQSWRMAGLSVTDALGMIERWKADLIASVEGGE